jgi:anthranilate phosphoribosyltransferase
MIREAIAKLSDGYDLSECEASLVMNEIMSGEATPAQISAYITALRMKGETLDEVAGSARTMRSLATQIRPKVSKLVDTCGTGGDGANTFNISTTAAFIVAGAGLHVAKHGNRSVSSKCGSADVLEALGIYVDLTPAQVEQCINETGIGFLFSPVFHTAMRHAIGPRKEIGIRTIFNILGPLSNPACAEYQVVGVYKAELTELLAEALARLGTKEALVVFGTDGIDEVSLGAPTLVSHLKNGTVDTYLVDSRDFGFLSVKKQDITGGSAAENAAIIERVLTGERGPYRDVALANAAAALLVAGLAQNLKQGVQLAAEIVDSGQALEKLHKLQMFSRRCAGDATADSCM